MEAMFQFASSFNQDLGWCVANKVKLMGAFKNAKCESTSCGIVHVADGDCPTESLDAKAASRLDDDKGDDDVVGDISSTPAWKYPRRDDWFLWLLREF